MSLTVRGVIELLERWAPVSLAEEWDNCGFQIGDPNAPVECVAVGLDVSSGFLDFAKGVSAQMAVTHHPAIFSPLKTIDLSHPTTRLLAGFLRQGIALASFHTNLDSAKDGVNDILADLLGLEDTEALIPASEPGLGLGRIGRLRQPQKGTEYIKFVSKQLNNTSLFYAGPLDGHLERAALCGGSGSSLFEAALDRGAQVFVTGEVKHSVARAAEEAGVLVIDAGHFHTEHPVVERLASYLESCSARYDLGLRVEIYRQEAPALRPWTHPA